MDRYEVSLWKGTAPDTFDAERMEDHTVTVTDGTDDPGIIEAALCALDLRGMKHRRKDEGDRIILNFGDMFATIDTY
jgi:hypothetical protein